MVTRKELLAQLAALPPECEGCGAPILVNEREACEYCGRSTVDVSNPGEAPGIRHTNACDDVCQACQQVHHTDPNRPVLCRCMYCGQIGPVAMSSFDSQLGSGVVCHTCCGKAAPRNFEQMAREHEAMMPSTNRMPWER